MCSNCARVTVMSMWCGPFLSWHRNGSMTCALICEESSFFAFSAASRTRSIAAGSRVRSTFSVFLNSATRWSVSR